MNPGLSQPVMWITLAMVSVAAFTDWRTGLIPNSVVALGALLGVVVQLLTVAFGGALLLHTLASMGLGFLLCTLLPGALYLAGGLGGGDLKLFAAIGVCTGPTVGLDIQLWAHGLAVLFLPFYFLQHGNLLSTLRNTGRLVANTFRPRALRKPLAQAELASLRFAPAIFAATLCVALLAEVRR